VKLGILTIAIALMLGTLGCTANERAKHWGGTQEIALPKDSKLVLVTWKEGGNLWYLVRARRADEKPETFEFKEKSNLGMVEGTVRLVEN